MMKAKPRSGIFRLKLEYHSRKKPVDGIICCIEEMSEVTKELTKFLRGREVDSHRLAEEIGHAKMMLDFVQMFFSIGDDDIEEVQVTAIEKFLEEEGICLSE